MGCAGSKEATPTHQKESAVSKPTAESAAPSPSPQPAAAAAPVKPAVITASNAATPTTVPKPEEAPPAEALAAPAPSPLQPNGNGHASVERQSAPTTNTSESGPQQPNSSSVAPSTQQDQQPDSDERDAASAQTANGHAALVAASDAMPPTEASSSGTGTVVDPQRDPLSVMTSSSSGPSHTPVSQWDKAKLLFSLARADELLNDLHDLKYIGAGGYGKVFKAVWRSAPVAVKLVPSHSPELFKSSSYKEALLCKELCHPNIVQTYETKCAQLTDEFVHSILLAAEAPGVSSANNMASGSVSGLPTSYGSQEFVSGDGFGLPSPVPDMMVRGRTLPEAAAKWKDILFTTGAKAGDYLTVIIMDFCDYGSLVRPIVKGMFRPFSASGSDREARVRYRALLRTAKEIAQGLEHLHHLRVVHGDLKPGNVLLKGSRVDVRGFNAQVIDFGLSHMVNNSNPQKVSKAGGTLVYAAPEVFSGRVGKAADVYSLGIILWEMVTGSQPYKDLVEGQIVLGVQKGGLRPAWPPGQLPQLQELYEKCVAQDPDTRPKAKEVVQFLTQIEMDLRAELRVAHKQQQAMQQMMGSQMSEQQMMAQQQHMAAMQQQQAGMQH